MPRVGSDASEGRTEAAGVRNAAFVDGYRPRRPPEAGDMAGRRPEAVAIVRCGGPGLGAGARIHAAGVSVEDGSTSSPRRNHSARSTTRPAAPPASRPQMASARFQGMPPETLSPCLPSMV